MRKLFLVSVLNTILVYANEAIAQIVSCTRLVIINGYMGPWSVTRRFQRMKWSCMEQKFNHPVRDPLTAELSGAFQAMYGPCAFSGCPNC